MSQQTGSRGAHLVAADRGFATGGFKSRLIRGGFRKLFDQIDSGLVVGSMELVSPDGISRNLGGRQPGPHAIVRVHSWRALARVITSGTVGWYKAWALGEWSSPDPVSLFDLFTRNGQTVGEVGRARGIAKLLNRVTHRLRSNSKKGSRRNIAFHYDLGNDFYAAWLDKSMTYSSALFAEPISEAEPLEAAQERKLRALLDRLDLRPGDRLLEIGCGWGSLAEIAARDYGALVTGITLSAEQKAYADARMRDAGLADRVAIELWDYRDVPGTFDAVASVEMVEAVGKKYWPDYLQAVSRALKPGRKAAIQLISMHPSLFDDYERNPDFVQAYIFPGGLCIHEARFKAIAEAAGLEWRDRKGFGHHYAETLRRWRMRFDIAVAEGRLPDGFDPAFHNLWRFYLMYCEGGFRGAGIDVAQITLVKR
jgi:cyclopropane-fatty-acyl-phospholipid synthase